MRVEVKREIVKRFIGGESEQGLWLRYIEPLRLSQMPQRGIEGIIRDYVCGKFTLEPRTSSKGHSGIPANCPVCRKKVAARKAREKRSGRK